MSDTSKCPKCSEKVLENDLVCLKCGTKLKDKTQGVRFTAAGTFQRKEKQTLAASAVHKKNTAAYGKSHVIFRKSSRLVYNLFSFIILLATIAFACVYFLDFDKFYVVSDYLIREKKLSLCGHYLAVLKTASLYSKHQYIEALKRQVMLEKMSGTDAQKQKITDLRMKIHDAALSDTGMIRLIVTVANYHPFAIPVWNDLFFLKNEKNIFHARPADQSDRLGPVKLSSSKMIKGSLCFDLPASFLNNKFEGELVFNDGFKYAISKVNFTIPEAVK